MTGLSHALLMVSQIQTYRCAQDILINAIPLDVYMMGKNQDLDNFLTLMSSFFEKKGYKWFGPLILKQDKDDLFHTKYKVIVPISRDLFKYGKTKSCYKSCSCICLSGNGNILIYL